MKRYIPGSDGYFITDTGKLISRKHEVFLSMNRGYRRTNLFLSNGGRRTGVHLHRLVAEAFVPGYVDGYVVNHKDGDKLNNAASNLEWVTQARNIKHAYDTGLISKKNRSGTNNPKTSLRVTQVHLICRMLKAGVHQRKIAERFGVTRGTIGPIKRKKVWTEISDRHF